MVMRTADSKRDADPVSVTATRGVVLTLSDGTTRDVKRGETVEIRAGDARALFSMATPSVVPGKVQTRDLPHVPGEAGSSPPARAAAEPEPEAPRGKK